MRKKGFNVTATILLVAIVTGFVATEPACADAKTDARIAKLEAALQALQSELGELKADRGTQPTSSAGSVSQSQIDQMVTKAIDQRKEDLGGMPGWVQNVTLFGDFRYRYENKDFDADTEARDRNRIRARLGLKAKINEEVDAIFRIATGSSDTPLSTNQTLGGSSDNDIDNDSFSSRSVWLDWAYFDYHPEAIAGLNIYGGKMKQPFYAVGKNELIWDGDLSPEGIVAAQTFDLNDSTTMAIKGGGFWLRERGGGADTSMWGLQAYAKHNLTSDSHILGGASYYDLGNIEDRDDLIGSGDSANAMLQGNTDNGSGGYKYDFNMIEGFAEVGFPILEMPSAVFASYIENTAALSKANEAYLIGARLNKVTSTPGSWEFGYNWREVDTDAVFGGLTDSDVFLGGTGGRGHEIGFKYQLMKDVQASLSYFITERDDRDNAGRKDNINVLHTDLIFKF